MALPVLVLLGAVLGARAILSSAPEAERREPAATLLGVEATVLAASRYPVVLESRGTVRPSRRTALAPEVSGNVRALSASFVAGGAFAAGEVLVQLDERDYRIALTRAQAGLAQAEAALAEQRAQAQSARADWRSLGRRGEPSALTLREPQTAAAVAGRDASEAEVQRARLDLERTRIVAPYAGHVLSREIDEGQFVARGAPLGVIYAIDTVEVRLPLSVRQQAYLSLPAAASGTVAVARAARAAGTAPGAAKADMSGMSGVEITLDGAADTYRWHGELLRAEGIDADTQQLNVVARIAAPFADPAHPLRIGRHVRARIAGRTLEGVFVIPRASLRGEREVLVLERGERLQRREVELAWSDDEVAVVSRGLDAGDVLVLTPLAGVADGTPVQATIDGAAVPAGAGTAATGEPVELVEPVEPGDAPDTASRS